MVVLLLKFDFTIFSCNSSNVSYEASVAETVVWPISFLFNVLTALKGSQLFLFLFAINAAGVVPCGGPKKSPPYTIHSADSIFLLVL